MSHEFADELLLIKLVVVVDLVKSLWLNFICGSRFRVNACTIEKKEKKEENMLV